MEFDPIMDFFKDFPKIEGSKILEKIGAYRPEALF